MGQGQSWQSLILPFLTIKECVYPRASRTCEWCQGLAQVNLPCTKTIMPPLHFCIWAEEHNGFQLLLFGQWRQDPCHSISRDSQTQTVHGSQPPSNGRARMIPKKSLFLHKSIHCHSVLSEQEGEMGQKRVSEKEMRAVVTFISRPSWWKVPHAVRTHSCHFRAGIQPGLNPVQNEIGHYEEMDGCNWNNNINIIEI